MTVRLSLAVSACRVSAAELGRFCHALADAGLAANDEVLVEASSGDPMATTRLGRAIRATPRVSLRIHSADATSIRLWGLAMARARGSHVGVLDARDVPAPGWVSSWSRAPADRIVCGPVEPGPLRDAVSRAAYLSDYGQFLAPLALERLEEVPGNNVVLPRSLLPPADTLHRGFWKTFHLRRLQLELGRLPLAVANEMVVRVHRHYGMRAHLERRFLHGRCYGARRLREPDPPNRWLRAATAPLLPALRTHRVLRRLRGKPTGPLGLRRSFAPLVLGEAAWSLGELAGYAAGDGGACERLG